MAHRRRHLSQAMLAERLGTSVMTVRRMESGHQVRKPVSKDDSCFFPALADTEPDAWGRRVIARAHAKERKENPALKVLTELDYLCAVDDFSRIGALRLRDDQGAFLRTAGQGRQTAAPLLELEHMFKNLAQ